VALVAACTFTITSAFAVDKKDKTAPDEVKMNERARKATAKALEWLASKQNSDGSWSEGRYPHNTAITSFALLAFLSQGHLPNQGLYGPAVAKGCRFLLASARADGYLAGTRGGNMYSHAMATLALAELWGMTGDKDIKPVLTKAVNLIVGCQNAEGGWRYEPRPTGADISVTIMQVMALRAAKNSGLHVKDETMRRAIAYIKCCYNRRIGGFSYQPGSAPGFARTAAGVCVLQLTGEYKAAEIPDAIAFLKQLPASAITSGTAITTPRTPCTKSAARSGRTGTAASATPSCPCRPPTAAGRRAIASRSDLSTRVPSPSSSCRCR